MFVYICVCVCVCVCVCHTFRAGPLSEALSLALFPSRPSWTKSSSRLTSSSSTICSAWRLAAMLPRALITAKEQCLHAQRKRSFTTRQQTVNLVWQHILLCWSCFPGLWELWLVLTCIHGLCSLWWSKPWSWLWRWSAGTNSTLPGRCIAEVKKKKKLQC